MIVLIHCVAHVNIWLPHSRLRAARSTGSVFGPITASFSRWISRSSGLVTTSKDVLDADNLAIVWETF